MSYYKAYLSYRHLSSFYTKIGKVDLKRTNKKEDNCVVQKEKLTDLKLKLSAFMERLDDMEPEETSIEDIDELIRMLEELENKI